MAYLSIEVKCEKCDAEYGLLVDRDQRNEPQLCDFCDGGMALRVWSVPHVSTTKTSNTIPEAVASGRFDGVRAQRSMELEVRRLKKEAAKDPTSSNRDELNRARQEKSKFEAKKE